MEYFSISATPNQKTGSPFWRSGMSKFMKFPKQSSLSLAKSIKRKLTIFIFASSEPLANDNHHPILFYNYIIFYISNSNYVSLPPPYALCIHHLLCASTRWHTPQPWESSKMGRILACSTRIWICFDPIIGATLWSWDTVSGQDLIIIGPHCPFKSGKGKQSS